MTIKKVKLFTTLELINKHNPCKDGYKKLINYLGNDYPHDKPINLLTILESNGINHFFWSWRATTKPEMKIKRLILHDIVASVEPIYAKKYPKCNAVKNVLKALKIGKGLKEAAAYAYAADAADAARYASDAAANAARSAGDAAANAARSAGYAAANAARSAGYAAYHFYYAYGAPSDAADAADAAAYFAAKATFEPERENQKDIIKRYLAE